MKATVQQGCRRDLPAVARGLIAAALLVAGCGRRSAADRNAPDGTTVTEDGVDRAVQTSRS